MLHGLGVEGTAALGWFLDHPTQHLAVIDTLDKLAGLYSNENVRPYTEQSFPPEMLPTYDLYLRSPGIPPTNPLVKQALSNKLTVTTPTGYWLETEAPATAITVTGTKGKSTTVSLIADILTWLGRNAKAYGNIGTPALGASHDEAEIPVLELSSYMMHDLPQTGHFHIVTNLYTEHTPWHGSKEAYFAAKLRPFKERPGQSGLISQQVADLTDMHGDNISIVEQIVPGDDLTLELAGEAFQPGAHHPAFAAASMTAALRTAVAAILCTQNTSPDAVLTALKGELKNWTGLPSRQSILRTDDGCVWIDDALATVPEATAAALQRWPSGALHLLLGGKDRGQSYDQLMALIAKRGETIVYAFGHCADNIATAATKASVTCISFDDLPQTLSALAPKPGETVLFSPAAPTAQQLGNYQIRAALFATRAQNR